MSSAPLAEQDNPASVEAGAVVAECTAFGQRFGGAARPGGGRDVVLALAAVGSGHGQGGGVCSARAAADGQLASQRRGGAPERRTGRGSESQERRLHSGDSAHGGESGGTTEIATAGFAGQAGDGSDESRGLRAEHRRLCRRPRLCGPSRAGDGQGCPGQIGGQARRRTRLRGQGMANPRQLRAADGDCSRKA